MPRQWVDGVAAATTSRRGYRQAAVPTWCEEGGRSKCSPPQRPQGCVHPGRQTRSCGSSHSRRNGHIRDGVGSKPRFSGGWEVTDYEVVRSCIYMRQQVQRGAAQNIECSECKHRCSPCAQYRLRQRVCMCVAVSWWQCCSGDAVSAMKSGGRHCPASYASACCCLPCMWYTTVKTTDLDHSVLITKQQQTQNVIDISAIPQRFQSCNMRQQRQALSVCTCPAYLMLALCGVWRCDALYWLYKVQMCRCRKLAG